MKETWERYPRLPEERRIRGTNLKDASPREAVAPGHQEELHENRKSLSERKSLKPLKPKSFKAGHHIGFNEPQVMLGPVEEGDEDNGTSDAAPPDKPSVSNASCPGGILTGPSNKVVSSSQQGTDNQRTIFPSKGRRATLHRSVTTTFSAESLVSGEGEEEEPGASSSATMSQSLSDSTQPNPKKRLRHLKTTGFEEVPGDPAFVKKAMLRADMFDGAERVIKSLDGHWKPPSMEAGVWSSGLAGEDHLKAFRAASEEEEEREEEDEEEEEVPQMRMMGKLISTPSAIGGAQNRRDFGRDKTHRGSIIGVAPLLDQGAVVNTNAEDGEQTQKRGTGAVHLRRGTAAALSAAAEAPFKALSSVEEEEGTVSQIAAEETSEERTGVWSASFSAPGLSRRRGRGRGRGRERRRQPHQQPHQLPRSPSDRAPVPAAEGEPG